MKQKLKEIGMVALVVILLPYVLTVFLSGKEPSTSSAGDGEESSYIVPISENGVRVEKEESDFLVGVLAKEMPVSYEEETLKAQAVIARTNLYRELEEINQGKKDKVDTEGFTMEEMKKLWGDDQFFDHYEKLKQAVAKTKGNYVKVSGEIRELPFHAVSAGRTRDAKEVSGKEEFSHCGSVESRTDIESDDYLSIAVYGESELNQIFAAEQKKNAEEENAPTGYTIEKRDSADYVSSVRIGNVQITGEEFRNRIGLNSSCFTLEQNDGTIKIICKGLGHGLGMSQYGANQMAVEGKGYEEILNYYFQNIEITSR